MGLDVGKITAILEADDRWTAAVQKMARESSAAARVLSGEVSRGAAVAESALAGTGQAATLAERQMRAMADAATKATEANRRLGVESESMGDKIDRGAKTGGLSVASLGRAIVAAFAVERLIEFGRHVVATAGKISDMSEQSGISVRAIQQLGYAANLSGGSLNNVTSAIGAMSKNLVGGEASAVSALSRLNLKASDLIAMKPDGAFIAIAEAIRKVPDPMLQADAAMRIFGEGGRALLPMIKAGVDDVAKSAPVMREDAVLALDSVGDSMTTLSETATTEAGNILGDFVRIATGAWKLAGELAKAFPKPSEAATTKGPRLYADTVQGVLNRSSASADQWAMGGRYGDRSPLQVIADSFAQMTGTEPTPDPGYPLVAGGGFSAEMTENLELYIRGVDKAIAASAAAAKQAEREAKAAEKLTLAYRQKVALQAEVNRQATIGFRVRDQEALGWEEYAGNVELARMELEQYLETLRLANSGELIPSTNPYNVVNLQAAVNGMPAAKGVGDVIKAGISSALLDIPNLFKQAFTGGGGVAGAFKALGVQLADAVMTPVIKSLQATGRLTARGMGAVSAGAAGAGALGGALGGSTAATIGSLTSTIAGVALATTQWGAAAALTTSGMVALSAATLGIGAAAVGVYLLARHFFTVSKEVKQARADVQAFQESLWETMTPLQVAESAGQGWAATTIVVRDAYVRMGYEAGVAERLVAKLLDTSKPEAAREAMAQINSVVGTFRNILGKANEQMGTLLDTSLEMGQRLPDALLDTLARLRDMGDLSADNIALLEKLTKAPAIDYKRFEEAAGRYGINQDALGLGYKQSKATATAQQMVDDVDLLLKGGASMGTILHGMQEEIGALVASSLKFGTTLPENMKPWIDELARTGQLVDKNGKAITDLTQLKFAESLETSFARVADSIQRLVDLLTGPLQSAFGTIPKNLTLDVDVNTGEPADRMTTEGLPGGFAGGTISRGTWFRDFQAGTPTVLHGKEAVVRQDQVGAFVSEFGGNRPVVVSGNIVLPNGSVLTRFVMKHMATELNDMGIRK